MISNLLLFLYKGRNGKHKENYIILSIQYTTTCSSTTCVTNKKNGWMVEKIKKEVLAAQELYLCISSLFKLSFTYNTHRIGYIYKF